MNILCCLISVQHVPNFLSVQHFKPDRIVLLESSDMKQRDVAKHFIASLETKPNQPFQCETVEFENASSFSDIRSALQQSYGKYPEANWIVNLTGGTKPMSIAAYEFFKAVGAKLIYIDFTKPNELIDIESNKTTLCK